MRLPEDDARARFAAARVARLATADAKGRPHLVPVTFAVDGDDIYVAVDHKPKTTPALKRLSNIAENPQVSALADRYDDDWDALWWVRGDGTARVIATDTAVALQLLTARYRQYRDNPPPGPVIAITVERWSGWAASS